MLLNIKDKVIFIKEIITIALLKLLRNERKKYIEDDERRIYKRDRVKTASPRKFNFNTTVQISMPPQTQYYSHLLQKVFFS